MKNVLLISVFLTALVFDAGMSFAVTSGGGSNSGGGGNSGGGSNGGGGSSGGGQSVPGPADSEAGLAGLVMAGGAAYLVWRRRKA